MDSPLVGLIRALEMEEGQIPPERRTQLEDLAGILAPDGLPRAVLFVCTHNSRRSQLAEIWLRHALLRLGIPGSGVYSAGTEATAFNERMVAALLRAGFPLHGDGAGANPVYVDAGPDGCLAIDMFSKTLTDRSLPVAGFAAVMVCDDADRNCPFVPGAAARFSLPYTDPKHQDGSPEKPGAYDATVREIGREMIYLAKRIKALSTHENAGHEI